MNTQHTPGPWQTDRNNVHAAQIATIHGCTNSDWVEIWSPAAFAASEETQEANARLIAAAPELLEALDRIADMCAAPPNFSDKTIQDIACAAIAKATGGGV